ncbi:hypothetical protein Tco_1084725, partial [Tanacetum coccineum]
LSMTWQFSYHSHILRSSLKPGRANYCLTDLSYNASVRKSQSETADSHTIPLLSSARLISREGRKIYPISFSTLAPLPGPIVGGELPLITAFTFTTRSFDNTPLANRASTSANPDPVIRPTFVEAIYEVLDSLLRDRRRQVRNEDPRTELDYYSEECDEEIKIEPRLVRVREATHVLRTGSPR